MKILPNEILNSEQLLTLGFRECKDIHVLTTVFAIDSPFALVVEDFNGKYHIFSRENNNTFSYKKTFEEMVNSTECHQSIT